ncbi:unnamed protein product [Echinostoma caproni]|uniref:Raptor_N domain-containing protein n=1 Tax=Echinostoma caproni TaxID=27848 RepID=A0A183A071_9TREM|nr:unnamed protein product [Echinostoma caproni]
MSHRILSNSETQSLFNEGSWLDDRDADDVDWPCRIAFGARHFVEEIEGAALYVEKYCKEKIKTLTVALVICLNIDIDPPDVQKIPPFCRVEAWFDPTDANSLRALETIGKNLQIQYERWHPRARYKQCLDPTLDDVKKLCVNLRRNAKEDRILFHYNGHGVPRPTENGEIWVFNTVNAPLFARSQMVLQIAYRLFKTHLLPFTSLIGKYISSNGIIKCPPIGNR